MTKECASGCQGSLYYCSTIIYVVIFELPVIFPFVTVAVYMCMCYVASAEAVRRTRVRFSLNFVCA